jgi:16S rRNA (guanine1207-N2)-methyltransferase
VNPALETLLLAFAGEDALTVPPRALFLGAEPHRDLANWPALVGWQPFKPMADAWQRGSFDLTGEPVGKFPMVLVLPGKSREETLAWFGLARRHLEPGGRMVVAMANTAGAARFEKELARATGAVISISKHKCRAFHAQEDGSWDEGLLDEWSASGEPRPIAGTAFLAQPGIFSADHIDPGSALLAHHLPAHLKGRVADLGAGWGFLADAALRRCPAIELLDLYEADARALACAKINLAVHQPRPLGFHWHDVTLGLTESYNCIVMNPPFHRGQNTDIELGRGFIHAAKMGLRRGGRLFMVANRQLPYEAALDASGLIWRCAAEDQTFKLLFADRR